MSPLAALWPVLLLLGAEWLRVSPLPLMALLGVLVVAAVGGLAFSPAFRVHRGLRWPVVLLGAAACAVAGLPALLPLGQGVRVYEFGHAVAPVIAMLAVVPWLPWSAQDGNSRWGSGRGAAAAVVISLLLIAAFHRWYVGPNAVIADEGGYLLQAGWLEHGWLGWRIPPGTDEFFVNRHVVLRDGVLYGQYPPGWPALVAAFSRVGLRQAAGALLALATLGATWRLADTLGGRRVAAVAVSILASSIWFVGSGASWMSHLPGMLALVVAAWLLLRAEQATGRTRALAWTGTGIALGVTFATRPFTALALAASLVIWRLGVSPVARQNAWRALPWLCVGGLPFAAAVMAVNHTLSGSVTTFGYTAVHGHHHDLGFGPRGFLLYRDLLERVPSLIDFSVQRAIANFFIRGRDMLYGFVPLYVTIPLLLAARHHGVALQWRHVLPFVVLPLAYFFYWSADTRFHVELLPLMAIGCAVLLVGVAQRNASMASALLGVLLLGSWGMMLRGEGNAGRGAYAETPWRLYQPRGGTRPLYDTVDSLQRAHGQLLLFSRDSTSQFDTQLARLMTYNGDGDTGPVLVARDRGPRNALLTQRYPNRTPFLVVRPKDGSAPRFISIP